MISLGITGYLISKQDIAEKLHFFKEMLERIKLKQSLPEEDMKKLRGMVTDVDPDSGIVLEEAPADDDKPAEEESQSGSGATLLD